MRYSLKIPVSSRYKNDTLNQMGLRLQPPSFKEYYQYFSISTPKEQQALAVDMARPSDPQLRKLMLQFTVVLADDSVRPLKKTYRDLNWFKRV